MKEKFENLAEEPTIAELKEICRGILPEVILEEFENFDTFGEAFGFAYTAPLDAGMRAEDVDKHFREKGIVEN